MGRSGGQINEKHAALEKALLTICCLPAQTNRITSRGLLFYRPRRACITPGYDT